MELLLIRHALPVRRELVDGPADPELAEAGRAQAEHLADYLASEQLHAIYASPMRRAVETATALAERQGVPIVIEDGVAEWDRDSNEYVPVEDLKRTKDPRWQQLLDGVWPGREHSPAEFQVIVVEAIERLVDAHPSQKIAIVCHGGVINAYLGHVLGVADPTGFFYPNYTSIHRVAAARSGERSILSVNETAHLRGTGLPIGINHP
ncbi:MAG: histidine phosphatase family protein [Acidimicrobiia bacterium]